MSDHIPDDDPSAPYTERMCRAVDRSFIAAFREGQKLERELMESQAEVARLRESASCMEGWLQKMECRCGPRSVCARCIALANGPTALDAVRDNKEETK